MKAYRNEKSSLLSRLLRRSTSTLSEKSTIYTPYIPTHAAPSFLSSTTPVTLKERYNSKQLIRLNEDEPTMADRADAMRAQGRERGEIRLDLVTC